MNETRKDRPEKLPANISWMVCRQCGSGVELIKGTDEPTAETEIKKVDVMEFEEPVTTVRYVRISKMTAEDGTVTTKKEVFSDKDYKILVDTLKL